MLVCNALFRRVELAAKRDWYSLGELDHESGWTAKEWMDALEPYFEEHSDIGAGPNARGPAFLIINVERERWVCRQIFEDPAGDKDWGFNAEIDLAASDELGEAVVTITDVGRL